MEAVLSDWFARIQPIICNTVNEFGNFSPSYRKKVINEIQEY